MQHLEINGNLARPLGNWQTIPHQSWHWYMGTTSLNLILASATANYNTNGFPQPTQSKSALPVLSFYATLTNHPFYKCLLGPISTSLEEANKALDEAISTYTLHRCTEGFYNPTSCTGVHGWALATTETILWSGAGPSDAQPQLMSPYRAELSGLVAGLHILHSICQVNQLTTGSIHMHCDCENAVRNIKSNNYKGWLISRI